MFFKIRFDRILIIFMIFFSKSNLEFEHALNVLFFVNNNNHIRFRFINYKNSNSAKFDIRFDITNIKNR
jgi:hypothetical protein